MDTDSGKLRHVSLTFRDRARESGRGWSKSSGGAGNMRRNLLNVLLHNPWTSTGKRIDLPRAAPTAARFL